MANLRGADLFWPSPVRMVFPGNKQFRMETGSKAEMVLFTALIVSTLMPYPVSGMVLRLHYVREQKYKENNRNTPVFQG